MDNTAKSFAQKIVSALESVKRLIHDAVSLPRRLKSSSTRHEQKTDGGEHQARAWAPNSSPEAKAACSRGHDSNTQSKERFPRLAEWKPIIEVVGLIVLVGYATITLLQWRAMIESNRINGEALVSVQRAFVNFKTIESTGVRDTKGKITEWRFFPQWENTGATPTGALRQHSSAKWGPQVLASDFDFHDAGPAVNSPALLAPKALISTGPLLVRPEIIAGVKAGSLHLYFWGWAVYRDIFQGSKPHLTEFCDELTVTDGDPVTGDGIKFLFVSCPRHNCADNDCDDYADAENRLKGRY